MIHACLAFLLLCACLVAIRFVWRYLLIAAAVAVAGFVLLWGFASVENHFEAKARAARLARAEPNPPEVVEFLRRTGATPSR